MKRRILVKTVFYDGNEPVSHNNTSRPLGLSPALQRLRDRAVQCLGQNIIATEKGPLIVAGAHQFRTLWTRDFCHSVPGLLVAGHTALVRRQLEVILSFQRDDGLLVRGLDVVPPQRRVVLNTAFRFLPGWSRRADYGGRKLRPEYLGEHGTPAMDSNVLTVLAVLRCGRSMRDSHWIASHSDALRRAMEHYRAFMSEGLVVQPGFSDWQDSARRAGAGLYLNLLLLEARDRLEEEGFRFPWLGGLEESMERRFFDPAQGVFRQNAETGEKPGPIPLEGNLWAVERGGFSVSSRELYGNLKAHGVWRNIGLPVFPAYTPSEISWTTRVVGLRGYHDGLRWSWLMAEAARVSSKMDDPAEALRILTELGALVEKSNGVAEVYETHRPAAFRTLLYRSEQPFTWGAAKIVEAIAQMAP